MCKSFKNNKWWALSSHAFCTSSVIWYGETIRLQASWTYIHFIVISLRLWSRTAVFRLFLSVLPLMPLGWRNGTTTLLITEAITFLEKGPAFNDSKRPCIRKRPLQVGFLPLQRLLLLCEASIWWDSRSPHEAGRREAANIRTIPSNEDLVEEKYHPRNHVLVHDHAASFRLRSKR